MILLSSLSLLAAAAGVKLQLKDQIEKKKRKDTVAEKQTVEMATWKMKRGVLKVGKLGIKCRTGRISVEMCLIIFNVSLFLKGRVLELLFSVPLSPVLHVAVVSG